MDFNFNFVPCPNILEKKNIKLKDRYFYSWCYVTHNNTMAPQLWTRPTTHIKLYLLCNPPYQCIIRLRSSVTKCFLLPSVIVNQYIYQTIFLLVKQDHHYPFLLIKLHCNKYKWQIYTEFSLKPVIYKVAT